MPLQMLSMTQLRSLEVERAAGLLLPLCICEISNLQTLTIRDCRGVGFAEVGMPKMSTFAASSLRTLTLASCNLEAVPYQVCMFPLVGPNLIFEARLVLLPCRGALMVWLCALPAL